MRRPPAPKADRVAHIEKYLPYHVVAAARQRILWCYENFDIPLVSFSGGTIDFVKWVFFDSPFAHLMVPMWCCWQMDSEIYCAGQSRTVIQWGPGREWLRQPPDYALVDPDHVYDIFSPDKPIANIFPGKSVVSMLGLRASESLARLTTIRHCARSRNFPCFIRRGQVESVCRAAPLYDWQTNDVLKYLSEHLARSGKKTCSPPPPRSRGRPPPPRLQNGPQSRL